MTCIIELQIPNTNNNNDGFYIQSIEYPQLVWGITGTSSQQMWEISYNCSTNQFSGFLLRNQDTGLCLGCNDSPSHPGSLLQLGSSDGNCVWDRVKLENDIVVLVLDIVNDEGELDNNGHKIVLEMADNKLKMQCYQPENKKQQFRILKYDQLKQQNLPKLNLQTVNLSEVDSILQYAIVQDHNHKIMYPETNNNNNLGVFSEVLLKLNAQNEQMNEKAEQGKMQKKSCCE